MKRYFIESDNIQTHITEWGDTTKPVIFCLHGLGSTGLSFIEIAEELKEEFRIISIDAPGHGQTQPFNFERNYEFPQMCEWLNKVLEKLNVNYFFFLSHSWGSFIALYYLINNSHKVKGSILIDGGYQSKKLGKVSLNKEIEFYKKDFEDYCESWEEFLDVAVYCGSPRRTKLLDIAGRDLALIKDNKYYWHARGATAGSIIKAMHKNEILDFFDEVPNTDIVMLRASLPLESEGFRQHASNVFEIRTNSTVKVIPLVSHMLHWDNPSVVVNEIRERWS